MRHQTRQGILTSLSTENVAKGNRYSKVARKYCDTEAGKFLEGISDTRLSLNNARVSACERDGASLKADGGKQIPADDRCSVMLRSPVPTSACMPTMYHV